MRIILLYLFTVSLLLSSMRYHNLQEYAKNTSIRILDTQELFFEKIKNIKVQELSALAYKKGKLYALSDKGVLFHWKLKIKDEKIESLDVLDAVKLRDKKGKKLSKIQRDSEGMCFMGDDLLISFEKESRVDLYSLSGDKIKSVKIAKKLRDKTLYRKKNLGLEAVAYNKKYGVLTAPEQSLRNEDRKKHIIYGLQKSWSFPVNGRLSDMEFMSKNKLMILQKKFNSFTRQWNITISELHLISSKYKVLASLKGWNLDNFEGLTKINKNRYLMISDSQDSSFQKTLLVLFELN